MVVDTEEPASVIAVVNLFGVDTTEKLEPTSGIAVVKFPEFVTTTSD